VAKLQYVFLSTWLNGKDLTCFTICILVYVDHGKLPSLVTSIAELAVLTIKCKNDRLSRNVGDYQSTLCNNPEERRPPSGHFASVCTQTLSWERVTIRMEIKFSLWDYISQTMLHSKIPVLNIMMKPRLSSYLSLTWWGSALKKGCHAMFARVHNAFQYLANIIRLLYSTSSTYESVKCNILQN
jgi:hypothetical protein